jgi:hypothetical protein
MLKVENILVHQKLNFHLNTPISYVNDKLKSPLGVPIAIGIGVNPKEMPKAQC